MYLLRLNTTLRAAKSFLNNYIVLFDIMNIRNRVCLDCGLHMALIITWNMFTHKLRDLMRCSFDIWRWLLVALCTKQSEFNATTHISIYFGVMSQYLNNIIPYNIFEKLNCPYQNIIYRRIFNIRRTKSPNLNVSRLVLQLSLPNPMKPSVKSRMKMWLVQRRQAMRQLHLSDR